MISNFKSISIIAPHPDDEVLGCGGLIKKFAKNKNINILIVSGHLPPLYKKTDFLKTKKECLQSLKFLSVKANPYFLEIPATKINEYPISELNKSIHQFITKNKSDLVCIPFPDRHIDHKLIFEACMVATRPVGKHYPKYVMCYETLSETDWNAPFIEANFTPNIFIDIEKEINSKISAMSCYKSQISPTRSKDAIKSLANYRGSQNGLKFAEAYQLVRCIL